MTDDLRPRKIAVHIIICLFIVVYLPVLAKAVTHGEEAVVHEEGEVGEHAAPWGDLLKRSLNFVVLVGILFYLLRKPAGKFFSNRTESIKNTLEDLERQKKEAQSKIEEYQQKLSALETERNKIIQDFIAEGETEKSKIIDGAHMTATRVKEEAERAIQQEVKKAKGLLQQEVAELSAKMAEDLLKKHMKDTDQQRLVDEYLAKVVEAK